MKLEKRKIELALNDRDLAKAADVSTATIYRAKKGQITRPDVMERIAKALNLKIIDVDEFQPALRENMFRRARRRGAPEEVLDEVDIMHDEGFLKFEGDFSERAIQYGALRLLREVTSYLVRAGCAEDVERIIGEVLKGTSGRLR